MATGMQGETIWSANAHSANVALFKFATMVEGGDFDLCGANGNVIGVFIDVAGINVPCSVQLDRVGKVTVGASELDAGDLVSSDAGGLAVIYGSGQAAGILLADGNPGDIVPIKLL